MPENPEERALAEAAKRGDEDAWRALFERHADAAYRFAYARTGRHRERAEEAVQEAWMIAVRKLDAYDAARGAFGAWLQGILTNVLANQRRRWARRDAAETPLDAVETPLGAALASSSPVAGATDDGLAMALTELPAGYQDALRAKYIDGHSTNEIAEQSGRSAKAVESLLTRARTALRQAYARQLSGARDDQE
jgi:RNA polymerase sigma-70 factor (ECF subfamily)